MNNAEQRLQHEARKGCGMIVVVFAAVAIGFFLMPKSMLGTTMIPELIGAAFFIIAFQAVSRRISETRLELAKKPFKDKAFDEVIELLQPFLGRTLLWPNARFDKTGEALYYLVVAFQNTDQPDKARRVLTYLKKYRRGEWVARAEALSLEN